MAQREAAIPRAKRASDRTFGFVFAALFAAITGIGWYATGRIFAWAVTLSGAFAVVAAAAPGLLMPLNRIWTAFGHRVAHVINHLLLGGFFYLLILPFGLFARVTGKVSISKGPNAKLDSYWVPVERHASPDTYVDMF